MIQQLAQDVMTQPAQSEHAHSVDALHEKASRLLSKGRACITFGLSLAGLALSLPSMVNDTWPERAVITQIHDQAAPTQTTSPTGAPALAAANDQRGQPADKKAVADTFKWPNWSANLITIAKVLVTLIVGLTLVAVVLTASLKFTTALGPLILGLPLLVISASFLSYFFSSEGDQPRLPPRANQASLLPEAARYVRAQELVISSVKNARPLRGEDADALESSIADVVQGRLRDVSPVAILAIEQATGKALRTQQAQEEQEGRRRKRNVAYYAILIGLIGAATTSAIGVTFVLLGASIRRRVRRIRSRLGPAAS